MGKIDLAVGSLPTAKSIFLYGEIDLAVGTLPTAKSDRLKSDRLKPHTA